MNNDPAATANAADLDFLRFMLALMQRDIDKLLRKQRHLVGYGVGAVGFEIPHVLAEKSAQRDRLVALIQRIERYQAHG